MGRSKGGRQMRVMFWAAGMALLLASCDAPTGDTRGITERLAAGDATVCADKEVQQTALSIIVHPLYREELNELFKRGETIKFSAVSATAMNMDIKEVSCSANIEVTSGGQNLPIEWEVRPSLDGDNSFIVEVASTNDFVRTAVGNEAYNRVKEKKAPPVEATSTPSEAEVSEALNALGDEADQPEQTAPTPEFNDAENDALSAAEEPQNGF